MILMIAVWHKEKKISLLERTQNTNTKIHKSQLHKYTNFVVQTKEICVFV